MSRPGMYRSWSEAARIFGPVVLFWTSIILGVALFAACPASAQEVEPETFPLRIDATESSQVLRLYVQCDQLTRPLTMVQPGAVTTRRVRVVDISCGARDGLLILSAETWNGAAPLTRFLEYDRRGTLGGVLMCVSDGQNTRLMFYATETLPISCAEAP